MSIYFIQAGVGGPVKIGYSATPNKRLKQLQAGHFEELYLVRVCEGDHYVESLFHNAFSHLRLVGEWFKFSSEMLTATISDICPIYTAIPEKQPAYAMEALQAYFKANWGSQRRLAAALGITPHAFHRWTQVPAERVLAIERYTGISRHDLRPDIYPREDAA